MNEFEKGVLYAVSQMVRHGNISTSAYVIRESGCTNLDCSELDKEDKVQLSLLNREKGIKLRGLKLQ